MTFIIELIEASDASLVGGKAANLARSAAKGFPVPDGLVLSRDALRVFLDESGWAKAAQALLAGYEGLTWVQQARAFEKFCEEIQALPIPGRIRAAVEPAVRQLLTSAPAGLSVRSSGICEDLEEASFAGIYESFLGITSLNAFWQVVRQCWCSAWSPKVWAYGRKMNLVLPVDGMAVLVQPLIPASSAGVIFTADPITGNPWRFVLNATLGLAPRLMDGSQAGDRFVLEWETGAILEQRIVRKSDAILIRGAELVEIALPENEQLSPALNDEQAAAIRRMALEIDRALDRRMDIEWAVVGEQVYLLQARPLTALPPFFPHEFSVEEAAQTWTLNSKPYVTIHPQERLIAPIAQDRLLLEMWDRFLTPDDIFPRRTGEERIINGYYYSTPWQWRGNPCGYDRSGIERWLDANEARLRQDWLAQLEAAHRANGWLDEAVERATRAVDWVRIALEFEGQENEMHVAVWHAAQWMIFTCDDLMRGFFEDIMPEAGIEGLPGCLLQGLSCYSVERTAAAQDLARDVQEKFVQAAFAKQPLSEVISFLQTEYPGCQFLRDFVSLCRKYGLEAPRLGKKNQQAMDVEGLLLVIKTNLVDRGAGVRDVNEVLAAGARQRQVKVEQVRACLRAQRPDQLERFNKLLGWAQFWTPALDNRKWHSSMSVRLTQLFRRTGEALVAEGLLDRPEHFMILTRDEWASYVKDPDATALAGQYRRSKLAYERNRRLEPLPFLGKPPLQEVLTSPGGSVAVERDQTDDLQPEMAGKQTFLGEGLAPGRARGIAYKVIDMEAVDYVDGLTSEHIIICAPAKFNTQWRRDWYSLFMIVRGLVTIQGAQLGHATQIARECGVPLLNLPEEEFDLLPDRVEIEIDGWRGRMTVFGEGNEEVRSDSS